jgi:predicted transglutaminase-like cysteine proteinase
MRGKSGVATIATFVALNACSANAEPERLTHVMVSEVTQPPAGWVEFCARRGATMALRQISLTPAAWMDLVRINKQVHKAIKPLPNPDHWGVAERWSYPDDGYGDCEDYVLLARRMLMQAGWPREALLITVVRDKRGDAHAVLTVKTDQGDFILDNQSGAILLWSRTGYRFIKRQSQRDPNIWVALGHARSAPATAAAAR